MEIPAELITKLRAAQRVAVLTGAGISAESGVPTFRDAQTGLWARYQPAELATPEAYKRDPRLVWEWYAWRRQLVMQAQPNPGHQAVAEIEHLVPEFTLITQNVDDLHQRAGSGERFAIIELHGNLFKTKCFQEDKPVHAWQETGEVPPRCPSCGGPLRPDVVWFGESLPSDAWRAAIKAARTSEIFFSIGTSGIVEPAASLPYQALQAGACVVEINLNETPLTASATYAISGPCGQILPTLIGRAWPSER